MSGRSARIRRASRGAGLGAAGSTGAGTAAAKYQLLAVLTCATYLLAGSPKLALRRCIWLDGSQLREPIAIDNVRKLLATAASAAPLSGQAGRDDGLGALARGHPGDRARCVR